MIAVRCSNCGRNQQLDTAFAGCICRCRFCSAIQTVPVNAPRVEPEGRRPWRAPRGRTLLRFEQSKPPATRKGRAVDVTLIAMVALAALLTVAAAGGAIAWVRSGDAPPSTHPTREPRPARFVGQ